MKPPTPDELRITGRMMMQTFNHEKKDLAAYLLAARTLFHSALGLAREYPAQADDYTLIAMMTSYNIAAAAWPGWEDARPDITEAQKALALEMCRFNVETAPTLDIPLSRRGNGPWILGAHLIANGDYDGARESFRRGLEFSEQAESADGTLMAQGWMLVCDILSGDESKRAELERLSAELVTLGEDGEFYASQFEPALKAFS